MGAKVQSTSPISCAMELKSPSQSAHFNQLSCTLLRVTTPGIYISPVEVNLTVTSLCTWLTKSNSILVLYIHADPIQKSSANTIIVAYALIPVVLLLAGSVVIVSVVLFYLKRRSKHQGQQPKCTSISTYICSKSCNPSLYAAFLYIYTCV